MTTATLDHVEELSLIQAEVARRVYVKDPSRWARERLGDTLWSKQEQIASALANNRRVAVPSCHEVGKSYTAAWLTGWWLDSNPPGDAFVVTSAPTNSQVRAILWREIGRVHTRGNLAGRVNQTSWLMPMQGNKEELVAMGRSPSDYDPTSLQGIHAPKVLVILDEACGIHDGLWEAADSLIANDASKILVIGNPDDPQTQFHTVCKPGSGWMVISISAFDSPNFTGEELPDRILQQLIGRTYVEEKRRKWAPSWVWIDTSTHDQPNQVRCVPPTGSKITDTNPLWQSKVLGQFPDVSDKGGLIPLKWITDAQQRTIHPTPNSVSAIGVDVGAGGDASAMFHRIGAQFRLLSEDRNPDTMQTCGKAVAFMKEHKADHVNVDSIGIGKGITDKGKEDGHPFVGINVGRRATQPEEFVNLRAELYWNVRQRFEEGEIDLDPMDDDTAAELVELRYRRLSTGKIQIESKDEMKRRGVPSPNRAEALMLANTVIPEEQVFSAVW